MADFKESVFDGVGIRRAASAPEDAIRKQELDLALAVKADQSAVDTQILSSVHPRVTTPATNQSLSLSVDSNQALSGEVGLTDVSIIQSPASARTQNFLHPIVSAQVLQLDRIQVLNVTVTRKDAGNFILAVGVSGTDFLLNTVTGRITILPGSNLITASGQKVVALFDCSQVADGPGLLISGGLHAAFGTAHEQIARGDHQHANDHLPVAPDSSALSTVASINAAQRLKVEVRLASASGLAIASGGLSIDPAVVSQVGHSHALVDGSNPGFMSPAMLTALNAAAAFTGVSVANTNTIALSRDGSGQITANVRMGLGLASDSGGLKIDFEEVAAAAHVHPTVTGIDAIEVVDGGTGYTTATISFTGGGGTGAAAVATLIGGVITVINVTNMGVGYTSLPTVVIAGDGTGAAAVAHRWTLPGFMHINHTIQLAAHETRLTSAETTITSHTGAIAGLASNKADLSYVNTQLALKAPLSHTHIISDVTGLQAALDGKADVGHTHAIVTHTTPGFMSSAMFDDFGCLSHLLNEQEAALLFMPPLRLESPSLNGGTLCPRVVESMVETVGGLSTNTYTLSARVRGCVETKSYTGGVSLNGGRVIKDGTPVSNNHNVWKMVVSDPAATYYLNASIGSDGGPAPFVLLLNYVLSFQVKGGATVTLSMDSQDNLQNVSGIAPVPGIAPYPATFSGQLIQVDAEKIEDYCIFDIVFGGDIPTIGGGQTPTNTIENGSPPDGPIQLIQQILRLDMIEDGEANGEVRDILIDGKNVWVGGGFSRYHNVNAWGLIKLDSCGRLDPFFKPGTGFSKPIDYIRKAASGVYVGTILDSLCQGSSASRPAWKIKADGTVDTAFVSPLVLNELTGAAFGADRCLGVEVLENGKICLLAPDMLTVVDATGAIFFQATGNDQFNSILAVGNKLLLSSHAWSTATVPQNYNGIVNPKGLKLLNMGADSVINIAAVGDFGTDTAPELDVSNAIKTVINPDAVLMLGDNNYETGDQSTIDAHIGKYYRKYIHPYYGSQPLLTGETDAITNQAWPCIGNHDAGNVVNGTADARTNPAALPGDLDYRIVTGLDLKNRGAAYKWPPTVGFSGGGGTGAAATATLVGSTLLSISITNGGSGYLSAPSVAITGGGGTGATATAVIAGGHVTAINITNAGTGFTDERTIVIGFTGGGGGSGAVAAGHIYGSKINALTLTNGGSGYTSAPSVAITGGNVGIWSITPHLNYFTLPGNERYYQFQLGDAEFFVLNSDLNEPDGITLSDPSGAWHRVTSVQALWLKDALLQSNARWKIVYFHHPVSGSFDWDLPTNQTGVPSPPYWMDWGSFYADNGADFVLSGHIHQFEHIQLHGIDYFNVGGGGKDIRPYSTTPVTGSVAASRVFEFAAMQMLIGHDSVTFNMIDRFGAQRYTYTKTKTPVPSSFGQIDSVWRLDSTGGSGAQSSCNRAVADPEGLYFIAGNALTNFNSPNTSWNAELTGNLLLQSQTFDNSSWIKVGAPLVVTANTDDAPDTTHTADTVTDSDGVDLAYIYQDVTVVPSNRYDFAIYVKKDMDETRFPLFRMEYRGGSATNDVYLYLNTKTGAVAAGGTMGPDFADISWLVEDKVAYWRLTIKATNAKAATTLRTYVYPAYSPTFGTPASSLTGSIIIWGAQLRLNSWLDVYVPTTTAQVLPSGNADNAPRFRGLYKILKNGAADPTFAVNLGFSEAGWAIPFAIDAQDRVYFGGPINSINGVTVTPWRLYRVTKAGAFDKAYNDFDDRVLVARLSDCGQLYVGGRFRQYGIKKVGRLIILNPDGTVVEDCCQTDPIISDVEPNVLENPCFADRIWLDTTSDPPTLKQYSSLDQRWISICEICAVTFSANLPPPQLDPPDGLMPQSVRMSVPGYPNAHIRYTLDDSVPTSSNGFDYSGPVYVSGTSLKHIKAYAWQLGYIDSSVAIGTYWPGSYQQVAPVTFHPPSGESIPCLVELLCATPGATIRYTVDGSTPTAINGITYSAPISVVTALTIKAYAFLAGYQDSIQTHADYIQLPSSVDLINIQFRGPNAAVKSGAAALGQGGDFWNPMIPSQLAISPLKMANGSNSPASFNREGPPDPQIYAAIADGSATDNLEKSSNALFADHDPATGAPLGDHKAWQFDISDLSAGQYELFFYHTITALPSDTFEVLVGGSSIGTFAIGTVRVAYAPAWHLGEHYCKTDTINIAAGQVIRVIVRRGVLEGLQIAFKSVNQPPRLPLPVSNPVNNTVAPIGGGVALSLPNIAAPYTIYYESAAANPPDPTSGSPVYSSPISVPSARVIRAFGRKSGYLDSLIATFNFPDTPVLPDLPEWNISSLSGVIWSGGNGSFVLGPVGDPVTFGLVPKFTDPSQDPGGVDFEIINVLAYPDLPEDPAIAGALLIYIREWQPQVQNHLTARVRARKAGYADSFVLCNIIYYG